MGGTGAAGFEGYAPVVREGPGNPEALKYGRLWALPAYREVAPGADLVPTFLAQARPRAGSTCIDFGCGTGRGAFLLAALGGLDVTMVDFVNNCLDDDVRDMLGAQAHTLRFLKADLEQPVPATAEYGYCTDVMEHIPEARVDRVLANILLSAQHVFFSIATREDRLGALIGERLHLTVQPYAWWLERLARFKCLVHWSAEADGAALFYVTAWPTGPEVVAAGTLNTAEAQIRANVTANIAGAWRQATPHAPNGDHVMLLGGGPSGPAFEAEIRGRRAGGAKLVTLNGAYNWALARGLSVSGTVVVDARPFNARFVRPVDPACTYFIASQCDPSVLEELPPERTYLWHTSVELVGDLLTARYPGGWCFTPGGTTVLLRALPLLRMLGYTRFSLYGCDSCLGEVTLAHHAYAQPENDGGVAFPVTLGGRVFQCHPWMAAQAQEFQDLVRAYGDDIEVEVRGGGLLAWTLECAARLQDEADAASGSDVDARAAAYVEGG